MRITAGRLRGKVLGAVEGRDIRPTADRTREAVFNILEHGAAAASLGIELRGAQVLDAFAGTGALGLEAFSRGAARITFIDDSRPALRVLRRNIAACKGETACAAMQGDVLHPPMPVEAVDIAFLDPPYGKGLLEPALAALDQAGWFKATVLVVAELAARDDFSPPGFLQAMDSRRYGATRIEFLGRRPGP